MKARIQSLGNLTIGNLTIGSLVRGVLLLSHKVCRLGIGQPAAELHDGDQELAKMTAAGVKYQGRRAAALVISYR